MTYVMADIHGELSRFLLMLRKIGFGPEDTLYVLGDVVDRSIGGVTLLQWIMDTDNICLLRGNHEWMMQQAFEPEGDEGALRRWFACGGDVTYRAMQELDSGEREKLLAFLDVLPEELDITVSGRQYHLVHARPGKRSRERLWHRPWMGETFFSDRTVILGHTPTACFGAVSPQDGSQRIHRDKGFIAIDCGCGHMKDPSRRLACLRLEDEAEFYV